MKKQNYILNIILLVILSAAVTGCGGGDGSSNSSIIREGRFLDSAVCGLHYSSGSQSGITDVNGKFLYEEGKIVKFAIGDIVLGEARGKSIITPLDFDPNGSLSHQKVVNISRFLLSVDSDGDPNNGIMITEKAREDANGVTIDFDVPDAAFDVSPFFNELPYAPDLVSTDFAKNHLQGTLKQLGLKPAFTADNPVPVKRAVAKFTGDYDLDCISLDAQKVFEEGEHALTYSGEIAILDRTDGSPAGLSSGDTISIKYTELNTGWPDDLWVMDGTLIFEFLFIDESSSTVRTYGEQFQESDEDETNIYCDFDTETQYNFYDDEIEVLHTIKEATYETNSPMSLKMQLQTLDNDPIVRIIERDGYKLRVGPITSGTIKITGADNSSISVTFPGGGLDNQFSLIVDENGDGNPEGTIQTTLRELLLFE
ncbi:MAG: hypothetical protein ACMUIL_07870 [bacterium]